MRHPSPCLVTLLFFAGIWVSSPGLGQTGGGDLEAVENQFQAALQLYVEEPYQKKVAELDGKYLVALERALESASQGGRLEEALALRDEVARVKAGWSLPGSDAGADPALAKLRGAYREQREKLRAAKRESAEPIVKKFEEALVELQAKLTREGKLQEAEDILALRKAGVAVRLLGAEAAVPLPGAGGVVRSSTAGGGDEGRPKGVPADAAYFQGRWFKVLEGRMGWDTAKRKCESLGGRLAVVPNQVTWAFLSTKIGNSMVWLGASDADAEGQWKWVDGTPLNFSAWTPGQPNNQENEDYLHTWKDGWNDNQRDGRWGDNYVGGCVCEWVRPAEKGRVP